MALRQNTNERVFVRLFNSLGNPVTGVTPANILGGNFTITKSDGTNVDIGLTAGVNWFEVDSTKAPGLYQILILAANLNLIGHTTWSIQPSGALFIGIVGNDSVTSVLADIANVQADTDNIQTRLPAALVGGRMDSNVGAMTNDVITAASIATDAGVELGGAVWATAARTLTAATNITSTGTPTFTQTGDSYIRLGAPVGVSISADIATVKTDLGNTLSNIEGVGFVSATDSLQAISNNVGPGVGADVAAIKAKTDNLPASPANEVTSTAIKAKTDLIGTVAVASQSDVNAARDSIKGIQLLDISTIAGGASFVSGSDNLHAIKQAIGAGGSSWDDLLANHNLSGSFGAAIRLIQQAVAGDQKIQVGNARLQFYDVDGVTILREFYLLDENNQPSINNVKTRKKV
ncbi:MAG: hypothetical protein EKK57_11255 [Proteobacteria bacterium]|nr:MAG: hypothetical protein EKK57_11255 [Pseudomonadota bacterium]